MLTVIWSGLVFLGGVVAVGWNAHDYVILRPEAVEMHKVQDEDIKIVAGKSDYLLDIQLQRIVGEISYLEREASKRQLTATEIDRLNALRAELGRLNRIKAGR